MTKPIEWTKPLRTKHGHELIKSVHIDRSGIRIETGDRAWWVQENGMPTGRFNQDMAIENIPPEPRIVTRWTEVTPGPNGSYETGCGEAFQSRFTPSAPHRRLAKLLIEETE